MKKLILAILLLFGLPVVSNAMLFLGIPTCGLCGPNIATTTQPAFTAAPTNNVVPPTQTTNQTNTTAPATQTILKQVNNSVRIRDLQAQINSLLRQLTLLLKEEASLTGGK